MVVEVHFWSGLLHITPKHRFYSGAFDMTDVVEILQQVDLGNLLKSQRQLVPTQFFVSQILNVFGTFWLRSGDFLH